MQTLLICNGAAPSPPTVDRPCRANEVLLPHIARRLGIAGRPRRAIIAKVRLLAERHGFPLPKTPRFVGNVRMTGADAIDARSVWDKDAVDLWFDDDRPPAESQGLQLARQSAARAEMQRRGFYLVAA